LRQTLTVTANPPPTKDTRTRVRSLVEEELERVKTLEDAEAVIRRAEQLAASKTEAQAGKSAADAPAPAPTEVERADETAPAHPAGAADALVETAAQAIAPTPEAPAVVQGAQEATGADHEAPPSPPRVHHGRSLLPQAVLRRMGPFQALDAHVYLEVNGQTRPRMLDEACIALVLLAIPIVLVGPSRLYLGQHWLSDVLGGYAVAAILLTPYCWAYTKWRLDATRSRFKHAKSTTDETARHRRHIGGPSTAVRVATNHEH
jgi:hypothetical protein